MSNLVFHFVAVVIGLFVLLACFRWSARTEPEVVRGALLVFSFFFVTGMIYVSWLVILELSSSLESRSYLFKQVGHLFGFFSDIKLTLLLAVGVLIVPILVLSVAGMLNRGVGLPFGQVVFSPIVYFALLSVMKGFITLAALFLCLLIFHVILPLFKIPLRSPMPIQLNAAFTVNIFLAAALMVLFTLLRKRQRLADLSAGVHHSESYVTIRVAYRSVWGAIKDAVMLTSRR